METDLTTRLHHIREILHAGQGSRARPAAASRLRNRSRPSRRSSGVSGITDFAEQVVGIIETLPPDDLEELMYILEARRRPPGT